MTRLIPRAKAISYALPGIAYKAVQMSPKLVWGVLLPSCHRIHSPPVYSWQTNQLTKLNSASCQQLSTVGLYNWLGLVAASWVDRMGSKDGRLKALKSLKTGQYCVAPHQTIYIAFLRARAVDDAATTDWVKLVWYTHTDHQLCLLYKVDIHVAGQAKLAGRPPG